MWWRSAWPAVHIGLGLGVGCEGVRVDASGDRVEVSDVEVGHRMLGLRH